MTAGPAVRITELHKRFRSGFAWTRTVHALRGLSLEVCRGEVLGVLGPNGAGKTTTLKALLGLIRATSGTVEVLGRPVGDPEARRVIGFLPENPYFYSYLEAAELLDLKGRLHSLDRQTRRRRAETLLARVGLTDVAGRQLRHFSKGMLQRVGLAQALMGDPQLVILDEPQTGLDPIGRREVRDLIQELRAEGRTVLFSSHVLSDVEQVSDRVALIVGGRLRAVGTLADLTRNESLEEVFIREAGRTGVGGAGP